MIGIPVFNFKKKVLIIMIGFNTSNTSYTDLVPGCVDNQILKNKSTLVRAFWWLSGEESACNAGATEDMGLIPESGRSPGGGHGIPLQYSCPENSKDRGAWWVTVHRVAKSWIQLKQLGMHTTLVNADHVFLGSLYLDQCL